eukprot:TRINITY_DN11732_c0_g1::TRINITY_DN11732_c0_g1_i1::g.11528::m.11528 TRINITY_DN11732_c0_g1::TRINITY_DN11732_c0_g1_i1::g.11528  ORF type:complete len:170 (+),score=23.27,sp/Q54DU9/TP4AA_DICDI/52.23/3e-53,DSPc/PF00782.15/8.7e-10,Y_phosphatase/PF00102.22/18,Y_phosphatase/PF00102.22/3.7e-07,PTPlike_phytase/PF14566.1/0.00082,CDKN3/PF05706.7/0.024,Pox_A31/PF05771.6/1.2,Pox_A31/PF05771.6/2.2e+02 TRINITY_DN11732_c0_g1_i1:52-561(+)
MTTMTNVLGAKPSLVEHEQLRFLIFDAPTDSTLTRYLEEMKKYNVKHLVRACEKTYDAKVVESYNIMVHELLFPDGEPPPAEVIDTWLNICQATFAHKNPDKNTIAVHCVAGLGRAPVLVAIALIERGMEPEDAIAYIRERRKGAINAKQLKFIESYKPRKKKKDCIVM